MSTASAMPGNGHGARNRAVRFDAQGPDLLAGAGGIEPLDFRIGIRRDFKPGRRDSNLCISKSSKQKQYAKNPSQSSHREMRKISQVTCAAVFMALLQTKSAA